MTQYERGRRLEWEVKKLYEEMGYLCVRSAGSHSPFDVVAFGERDVVAIQCKLTTKSTMKEQKKLIALLASLPPCVSLVIATKAPRHGVVCTHLGNGLFKAPGQAQAKAGRLLEEARAEIRPRHRKTHRRPMQRPYRGYWPNSDMSQSPPNFAL